jgi:transcriptional regulator with XRE-family HTH domain
MKDPKAIKAAFGELLNSFSDEELLEMEALAIGQSYLSEAQRIMDDRPMLRKDLAERMGVSASFLTQLFRGDRPLSDKHKALLQRALGIRFEVKAVDMAGRTATGEFEYPEVMGDDWMQAWFKVGKPNHAEQTTPKEIQYYEKTA